MTHTSDAISDDDETAEHFGLDALITEFYQRVPHEHVEAEFGALTNVGRVRKNNEDQFLVMKRFGTREVLMSSLPSESLPASLDHAYAFSVADGIGGRDSGELASFLALRTSWLLSSQELSWSVRVDEGQIDHLKRKADLFFQLIHEVIRLASIADSRHTGMGTTLTLGYSSGSDLYILHAGDSRAYLVRNGQIKRLTRDHTMAELLMESGLAAPDSDLVSRTRSVLVNCLGGEDFGVDVDFHHQRLLSGDRILLCSDGLSDMISDERILEILTAQDRPDPACHALVNAALEQGGRDNITVVLAQYQISHPPAAPDGSGLDGQFPASPTSTQS